MRKLLLTIFTSLLFIGCTNTTTHNTYNNECKCKQCGSISTSPSDTICGPTEDDDFIMESDTIEKGEQ